MRVPFKKKALCGLAAAVFAITIGVFSVSGIVAEAQTFTFHLPAYDLYSENTNAIKSGEVSFDLSDFQSENLEAVSRSRYAINSEIGKTEHFSIPFIARVMDNIPEFAVKVNEREIAGKVVYGERYFDYDGFNHIESLSSMGSSEMNESSIGTLYTVTPAAETVVVNIDREGNGQKLLYSVHAPRSSQSAGGHCSFTYYNMKETNSLRFYITDGDATVTVENATFEKKSISSKAYVDSVYDEWRDFLAMTGVEVPVDFFYTQYNGLSYMASEDELFIDAVSEYRIMAYEFEVVSETENYVVEYEQSGVSVIYNGRFSPAVYMVEQHRSGDYPISFSFKLSDEFPYALESNGEIKKQGDNYTVVNGDANSDFYMVFSSAERPTDLLDNGGEKSNTLKIVLWVLFGVAVAALCVSLGFLIHWLRHKPKNQ